MRTSNETQFDQPQAEDSNNSQQSENKNQSGSSNTPSISAPKGGGAISSIGEKFQANPVTGTGSMSVPVALSPGRNGFTPQLALSYDSGNGNTEFGMGWGIGIPSISRKTQKGLPKYQDAEESDIFLLAGSEDLIPKLVDNGGVWEEITNSDGSFEIKQYRPRIEGLHAKIEKHTETGTGIVHWEVTTKDNITSVYGLSPTTRVHDPSDGNRVFEWMLEHTYDEKGNIILYEYKRENTDGIDTGLLNEKNRLQKNDAFNKLYLKAVKYTSYTKFDPLDVNYFNTVKWHFQLVLDYGEHDLLAPTTSEINSWVVRQDPISSFRSGFEIRTYRLCRRLLMFHYFDGSGLGVTPYLVKSTNITHDENAIATRITSVKHVCHKLYETPLENEHEYPPVDFTYSEASIDTNIYQHGIEDLENLPNGVDGSQYRWTDLHGEGLSGVLIEDQNAWYFKKNLGDENYYKDLPANETPAPEARLGAVAEVLERPSLAGGQQLTDIDGNGTPDLVVYSDTISGYYEKNKEGGWENFRAFESNPNINWSDPDLRRIDIDGDGFADLLITQDNCFVCYPSQAEKGFGPSYETLKSFEEEDGPKIVFSDTDQSVYLSDMSGDGLTDIVRIKNGSVCYWPNKGYGIFGAKVSLDNAPWFDHEDIFNQQRIRLADVDGSGTTDIIYIANDCVKYYPNQSGNSFGDEILINQRLPTHNLANIATLDILGNGTQCLVWSSPVEADHPPAMKYIDLMGGTKPYLLTEVNNNMGSISRMKYAPSTKFYLRDERNGTPWITKLPFPVLVVERVELWDEVNRNRFVSKYAYHHGYFDGVEREFRGFGMVEQWDTESFTDFEGEGLFPPGYNASEKTLHVDPVYTKSWFHLGFYQEGEKILDQYRKEYWDGDIDAFSFAGHTELDVTLSLSKGDIMREAARALKGSPLRQEVYSQDGSPLEANPYVVTENTYEIKLVQPVALRGPQGDRRRNRDYASFQTIPAETISYQYERNPVDPRISHQLTLETDDYGQVLKAAAAVYPRRSTIGYAQQDETKITIQENTLINEPNNSEFYRLGVPLESKSYEFHDQANALLPYTISELRARLTENTIISSDNLSDGSQNFHLDFDGSDNYVAVRKLNYDTKNSLTQFTIEAWVNTTDSGSGLNRNWAIFDLDKSEYFNFYVHGQGQVSISARAQGYAAVDVAGTSIVNDGNWHHLAGVYDGTDIILYVNGVEDGRLVNPFEGNGLGRTNTRYPIIGDGSEASEFDGNRNNKYFKGQITELRYWDVVRTPAELAANKDRRLTGKETGLKLYFDMSEGSGSFLLDKTGNGHNGIMRNMDDSWLSGGPSIQTLNTRRLLNHSRTLYYDEALSATPLATGSIASHALPYETYQLALTDGQLTNTLNEGGVTHVDPALLTEGKYIDLLSNGDYWVPSGQATFDAANFYLPTAQTDPFGNQTLFEFDIYHLLLTKTTDALGNEVAAQYDYRLLQPDLVTDPNGNRQAFEFDVRGMVTKLAVMGKVGDSDGDTLADPTTEFAYDLFEWSTNQKPNYAYSKSRETHGAGNTRFIESYAYSDGLGQVIMTKNKVANGLAYGRDANGDLLREGDGTLSQPVDTAPDPRWIGSGRTILDNKGNPIKQYEPYFSSTEAYETEAELVEYGVTPVIHYDPLGRAIRTELPDDTLTRVEFTPWEQKNYDQNDTVKSSLWYATRNGAANEGQPEPTDREERAAWLAAKHDNTPQTIHLDVLGRPFVTIDHNKTTAGADELITMTTELDILGNPLSITDAKGRTSFTYTYGVLNQPLKTTHLDNGTRYAISDVAGNPLRAWDDRSQQFRFAYDELLRPTKTYLIDNWSHPEPVEGYSESLISLTVHGESLTTPEAQNLRGQAYLTLDSAGMVKNTAVDFKGNPLATERQMAVTYQTSPDWSALDNFTDVATLLLDATPLLSTEVFVQSTVYDALNRPVSMTKPDSSVFTPGYDDGGQLETISTNLRGAGTATDFVTAIKYNERGQRKSITYGNGAHTTYKYDEKTFRLTRLRTTRNSGAEALQDLNYIFDPVGNIVEMFHDTQDPVPYSETVFYNNAQVTADTKYTYDALYRLLSGTGRQMVGLSTASSSDVAIQTLPDATATALELYTQSYEYDELGNILKMAHEANSGNWNRFYHYNDPATNNYLLGTSNVLTPTTTDHFTYDAHGNMTAMPHLSSMSWDYADRLQSANLGGGGMAYYTYDAGGDRARKVIVNGNITEERIYLGDYEVYRKTVSGTLDTEKETLHISDDTGRIALIDTLTVDGASTVSTPTPLIRYQLSNHLGSATLELDDSAAIISYEEYHPFGSTSYRSGRNSAETSLKRYRYVGKERDDETGLYYYGARYYAAWLARFVSTDPLKDDYPYYTSYQYAGNRPINFIDLDGLEPATPPPQQAIDAHREELRKTDPEEAKLRDDVDRAYKDAVTEIFDEAIQFFTEDIFKAETYETLGKLAFETSLANLVLQEETPIADAIIESTKKTIEDDIINGDTYSRTKAGVKLTVGTLTSIAGDKGISKAKTAVSSLSKVEKVVDALDSKVLQRVDDLDKIEIRKLDEFITPQLSKLQNKLTNLADEHLLPAFKEIDPDLTSGFTGSFKTGKVGNPTKSTFGEPINLNEFDVDFFIESDVLFEKFGKTLQANKEFRNLLSETPGFEGLKPGKGGFSILFKPSKR